MTEEAGYCWLIECDDGTEGGPHYWVARPASSLLGPWTTDPFKAVRFSRKEDAENIAVSYAGTSWKAVCHHFDAAQTRSADSRGQERGGLRSGIKGGAQAEDALRERERELVAAIEAALAYCESEAIGTVQQEIADNERMRQTLRDALEYGR